LLGSVLFLIPMVLMNSNNLPSETVNEISDIVQIYVYVVLIMALVSYTVIYFFKNIFLTPISLKNRLLNFKTPKSNSDRALVLIGLDRQFMIIRNALFEGTSLFAIVAIFLEIKNSNYQILAEVWLLALPIVIHAIYLLINFPTKDKILDRIETEILNNLKN